MKTKIFTMLLAATSLLCGCSKEQVGPDGGDGQGLPITFTLATPGSDGVIYPKTKATHDAPEYAIKQMSLLVYDATDEASPKFLRKHDLTSDIKLYDNGNGTYNFSLEAPISDMNAKRKFVFVVNDDAAVAATEVGSTESDLHTKTTASIELSEGNTADKLAEEANGIAMSGTATSDGVNDVITIAPGVKCEVKLTRIVARVDIQNNTPNMTIESAVLVGAATKGYLFGQQPLSAPATDRIILGSNANVDITEEHPVGGDFTPKSFSKVFYTYERPNTIDDYAAVRVTYKINGENTTTLEIPFIRTEAGGGQTPVDITRNHLYTIVLGNGKPVTTNEIKFSFVVEDWNEVEMPEEIGPGDELDPEAQAALNAKLMVNMFTEYNAKEFNLVDKTITSFYDKLAVSKEECPSSSYVAWTDLKDNGALTAEFTGPDGKKYRLPTAGEMTLLIPMWTEESDRATVNKEKDGMFCPYWNGNSTTNTYPLVTVSTPFTETAYFKNDINNCSDKSHPGDPEYTLSGVSQMKVGDETEQITYPKDGTAIYDIHPVYGLRFKGTNQYAAYCWKLCTINSDPLQCYLSIKIKALHPQDSKTTIDDVAQKSFWADGSYIEFQLPCSGFYTRSEDNRSEEGIVATAWGSTLYDRKKDTDACRLGAFLSYTDMACAPFEYCMPLRFVKVDAQQ
ncbi:hypothetical protein [Millionella massiliensis]|uniref:hypothetical protein n=1 Tax=Millionella massiliensis TaxID=1871023 RepID=UPI0008DA6B1C|nr:hypothetical protein [Millionella massiliensis]